MALKWPPNTKNLYKKVGRFTELKRHRIYILIAFLVVVGVVAVLSAKHFTKQKEAASVDCSSVVNDVNKALNDENLTLATTLLRDNEKACAKSSDKTSSTLFNAEFAVVTYRAGEREQAKMYAERSLEIAKSLSATERADIVNFESTLTTVNDIKNGQYDDLGGLY